MFKTFKKIKKIMAYIPLLWADEDWDYYFMFTLLKFKIDRMADCIEKNDIIVEAGEICQQMRECSAHIGAFLDGDENDMTMEMISKMTSEEQKAQYIKEDEDKQAHLEAFLNIIKEKSQGWWD